MNSNDLLTHHGIKGMHWGVRRFQKSDGSLTKAGIKRYAQEGYSKDAYNSNKTKAGKAYDKITGAHEIAGKMKYNLSSKKERKAKAEQYAKDLEVERLAKAGFSKDAYNSNTTKAGKVYDKITGAHKISGEMQYNQSSKKEREDRAAKYAKELEDKNATKESNRQAIKEARASTKDANKEIGRITAKGALAMIGTAAVGGIATSHAYASGNSTVAGYIAKGTTLAEVGIFAGSVGKMVNVNVNTYKTLANKR